MVGVGAICILEKNAILVIEWLPGIGYGERVDVVLPQLSQSGRCMYKNFSYAISVRHPTYGAVCLCVLGGGLPNWVVTCLHSCEWPNF